jgi:hypothetical protein
LTFSTNLSSCCPYFEINENTNDGNDNNVVADPATVNETEKLTKFRKSIFCLHL